MLRRKTWREKQDDLTPQNALIIPRLNRVYLFEEVVRWSGRKVWLNDGEIGRTPIALGTELDAYWHGRKYGKLEAPTHRPAVPVDPTPEQIRAEQEAEKQRIEAQRIAARAKLQAAIDAKRARRRAWLRKNRGWLIPAAATLALVAAGMAAFAIVAITTANERSRQQRQEQAEAARKAAAERQAARREERIERKARERSVLRQLVGTWSGSQEYGTVKVRFRFVRGRLVGSGAFAYPYGPLSGVEVCRTRLTSPDVWAKTRNSGTVTMNETLLTDPTADCYESINVVTVRRGKPVRLELEDGDWRTDEAWRLSSAGG